MRFEGAGSWMRVDVVRVGNGFVLEGGSDGGTGEDEAVVVNMFAIGVWGWGLSCNVCRVSVGRVSGWSFLREGNGRCMVEGGGLMIGTEGREMMEVKAELEI
jgi:hypothetical protein